MWMYLVFASASMGQTHARGAYYKTDWHYLQWEAIDSNSQTRTQSHKQVTRADTLHLNAAY